MFVFFLNSGGQASRLQVEFPMDFKLFRGAQSRADDYELTDRFCVAGFIRRRKKGSGALMRAFLKRSWGVLEALRKGFWRAPGVSGTVSGGRGGSGALLGVLGASGGCFGSLWRSPGGLPRNPGSPQRAPRRVLGASLTPNGPTHSCVPYAFGAVFGVRGGLGGGSWGPLAGSAGVLSRSGGALGGVWR